MRSERVYGLWFKVIKLQGASCNFLMLKFPMNIYQLFIKQNLCNILKSPPTKKKEATKCDKKKKNLKSLKSVLLKMIIMLMIYIDS